MGTNLYVPIKDIILYPNTIKLINTEIKILINPDNSTKDEISDFKIISINNTNDTIKPSIQLIRKNVLYVSFNYDSIKFNNNNSIKINLEFTVKDGIAPSIDFVNVCTIYVE